MTTDESRGFTLIELMVTVVIVGILAALAYPSYEESLRKTRRAEGRAALLQLMQQEERFYSHGTTYIAFSAASSDPDEKKFKWFSGESAPNSSYEIDARACNNDTIQHCVLLTAKPGTGKVNPNFIDIACGHLMLASSGEKTASGTAKDCWR